MQIVAFDLDIGDRILRDDTAVVLDTYIEVSGGKHSRPESKYFCQAARPEPMIDVAPNVRLQNDVFLFADQSATINKVPGNMPNFRDMHVRRNLAAIGQNKSGKRFRMVLKDLV
jgi:hypothetical protein